MMNGIYYKIYTNGNILQLNYNYGNFCLSRIQNQKAEKFKLNRSKSNTWTQRGPARILWSALE